MKACWEITRELNCTMSALFAAVDATGLRGRLVNGRRVWNAAEVKRLRAHITGPRPAR
jgi:hypothetical protein